METFSDTDSPVVVAGAGETPAAHKRPGIAFLLSLIYPGLGHAYCGKVQTAVITGAFFTGTFLVALLVSPAEGGLYWGVCLRAAIVLYGYAFLDAFYTAREINAGVSESMVGNNPRIAAMLNLLTAGFGYFYLGSRTKGIVWFIVSRAMFAVASTKSAVLQVIAEVACVVVALDAFRIARNQQREAFPPESTATFDNSPQRGLSPIVPVALGAFMVLNYALFITFGVMVMSAKNARLHQAPAVTKSLPEGGILWKDGSGLEVKLPYGWQVTERSKEYRLDAAQPELGCKVILTEESSFPLISNQTVARRVESHIRKSNPTYRWLSEGPASLGDKQAYVLNFELTFKQIPVMERITFVHHGITLFSFIEAASIGNASECGPEMEKIAKGLKFPF